MKQVVLKSGVVLEADVVIAGIGSYFSTSVFLQVCLKCKSSLGVFECGDIWMCGLVFANIAL